MNTNLPEPKEVFEFFYQICEIPHGTYNIDAISEYLADFAKKRGLEYIKDSLGNVIIFKGATPGYENEPAIIIQGHTDMVTVCEPESGIDMTKDPLSLVFDGEYLSADKTSLGGDDGIAVAYALAILDSDTIKHPAIEAVFTVNEEVGMDGALGIDLSMLKGSRLMNIDSEEEGVLLTSCAGGIRVQSKFSVGKRHTNGNFMQISISGLKGGHSGTEIHKGRANAAILMGRILKSISMTGYKLSSVSGGEKDNAIPYSAEAVIEIPESEERIVTGCVAKEFSDIRKEFAGIEENIRITAEKCDYTEADVIERKDSDRFVDFLVSVPNGVMSFSGEVKGLVETSLNLGIMSTKKDCIEAAFALRSSKKSAKDFLKERMFVITKLCGGEAECFGDYPAWEFKSDSPLRDKMVRVFKDMYGYEPKVEGVHAGLECGILAEKIEHLDAVSFGPDILDIHTVNERLDVKSVERTWEYILKVLETKG
ncbi:MAG: aminoacyl-histidine dipeptidase [Lachnospiraceae bacterium]|nr:aminoacyl-histidine dipeptidase [Lachnospiraceae bacterium]